VAPTRSNGPIATDKMETSLLSNQEIVISLLKTCMQYQSCHFDPLFGLMVIKLGHLFQLVLQDHVACTSPFERSKNNVGLEKKLSHVIM
jgi:hypothetical protein